ncbi:hypothetical protein Cgig2_032937 [Carnegiea gigantea]|uniref:Uncharacterized protein n=1 Tax=Carnegiea gigantea TaxID=171969 RepID=A0A9Q1JQT2_9CARY|nr:hypothetical protein Cgig2_032937 [Carnegiea gigantea]
MTSSELGNGLGNKSSMPRSDKHMFVARSTLKSHKLYASKSHDTYFVKRGANIKVHLETSITISKSTNSSLMRHSSISANSGVGDPFNLMRHFPRSRNHGFPPPSPYTRNDAIDANNDENNDVSFSENDVISSLEDEDLHNPQCNVFSTDDMELYCGHIFEHMHALWTNWRVELKRCNITKPRSIRQALGHVPNVLNKHKWECLMKEIYSKNLKRFHSNMVLGLGGGVKPQDTRGLYSTRAKLEVELNAIRRKNKFLTDRLVTAKAKNKKLQNHLKSVETEPMKIKDLTFQQFNTRPSSTTCNGYEPLG